jgi:hypothetical protein
VGKFNGGQDEAAAIIKAMRRPPAKSKKKRAEESVSHPVRCRLCNGPAIPMAAGGYRCGNPPCEWVSSGRSFAEDFNPDQKRGQPDNAGQFGPGGGGKSSSDAERIGKAVWGVRDEDKAALEEHAESCEKILENKKFATAVKWYTGKGYESLNETARKCPPDFGCLDRDQRKKFDDIESAIAKAPSFSEPVLLYRSIDGSSLMLNDRLKKAFKEAMDAGSEFAFPSLTSTSSQPGVVNSESFGGTNGIAFQIRAKTGLAVKSVSKKPEESEVIQSAKTRYKVAGMDMAEFYGRKRFTVYLEEV